MSDDDYEDEDAIYSGWRDTPSMIEAYAGILRKSGLSTCPFNITACRFAMETCNHLDDIAEMDMGFRVLYSEKLGVPLLFVGALMSEGQFAPMLMVMTSEAITAQQLGLYCGGEYCDHESCEAIPDGLRKPPTPKAPRSKFADGGININRVFARMVNNVDAEMPRFEDLARFYDVPKDRGKGGD